MVHWAGLVTTSKWDLLGIWRCMSNFVSDEHCGRVLMLPLLQDETHELENKINQI
jgi:hypothetical protein